MQDVSTNFAITLVCKREYDVMLWRHKQHISIWASAEGKNGHLPPLEIRSKNKNFQKPEVSNLIPITDLILAMTVYLPISHSRCTRARFIDLVLCRGEIVVHSCLLLCQQRKVAKLTSRLFYCWSLFR